MQRVTLKPYKGPKANLFHGLTFKDLMFLIWTDLKAIVAFYNVYLFISKRYLKDTLFVFVSFLCASVIIYP